MLSLQQIFKSIFWERGQYEQTIINFLYIKKVAMDRWKLAIYFVYFIKLKILIQGTTVNTKNFIAKITGNGDATGSNNKLVTNRDFLFVPFYVNQLSYSTNLYIYPFL